MSTEIIVPSKCHTIRELRAIPEYLKILQESLPQDGSMKPDEFIACAAAEIDKREYAACTIQSKFEVMRQCCASRLLPGKVYSHVALIPRKQKNKYQTEEGEKERWVLVLTAMPEWRGYKAMMERNPDVRDVTPVIVHLEDNFVWDEMNHHLQHDGFDPLNVARSEQLNDPSLDFIRGGYTRVLYKDGTKRFHFTTINEIRKRRACALTTDVWNKWPKEQTLKTLIRDCYSRGIVSVDPMTASAMSTLVAADDEAMGSNPAITQYTNAVQAPPPLSRTEVLAQTLGIEDASPETEIEEPKETKPKKKTTKKRTKKDVIPEPPVPPEGYETGEMLPAANKADDPDPVVGSMASARLAQFAENLKNAGSSTSADGMYEHFIVGSEIEWTKEDLKIAADLLNKRKSELQGQKTLL